MEVSANQNLFQEGKRILDANPLLAQVVTFMEHPVSREFYDKWMTSPDFDNMRYVLWIYEQVERETPNLLPIERLGLIQQIIRSGKMLHQLATRYNTSLKQLTL